MEFEARLFLCSARKIKPDTTSRGAATGPFLLQSRNGLRIRNAYLEPESTAAQGCVTPIGFVLIDIEPNREKEVYEILLKLPQIVELYPLFGEYDIIAKVEADSFDEIGNFVVQKIRSLDGVKATKTLPRMSF